MNVHDKIARIIVIIEEADALFKDIELKRPEALALWNSGVEKLAGAIWIAEKEEDELGAVS